ncbi:MAG: PQQ-binding-like beta-propeller repeat protein [Rhizomicrobium sp.]
MNLRSFRGVAAIVAAATILSACSTFDEITHDWFNSSGSKSKLKGERISVMATDETLKLDDSLASTNVELPPPYRNDSWANPGGYPSNAMYHLEATGSLQQIWSQEAGKGSDTDSRLTAPPIVVNDTIYVLDAEAHVFAFNAQTGAPLWNRSIAPNGSASFLNTATLGVLGSNNSVDPTKGAGGGLAFDGGKIFATTGFGDVIAMSPQGKQLWRSMSAFPS